MPQNEGLSALSDVVTRIIRDIAYLCEPGLSLRALEDMLRPRFTLRVESLPVEKSTFYDTFDGRLGRSQQSLQSVGAGGEGRLRWRQAAGGSVHEAASPFPPAFARDLPRGTLQDGLAPVVEMRRLLPQVEVQQLTDVIEVLDSRRKVVVRVVLTHARARDPDSGEPWKALTPVLRLRPLRGYPTEQDEVHDVLRTHPGLVPTDGNVFRTALAALGRSDRHDPTHLSVDLDPYLRAEVGMRRIHLALLEICQANEAGLRADLDSEFLHDYRVAIRRTRALLGTVKKVFPMPLARHFRAEFQWLGGVTGPVRDMDVFLLRLEAYQSELPGADFSRLAEHIRAGHRAARLQLLRQLDSARYRTLLESWRGFLENPSAPETRPPRADQPLRKVAARCIRRIDRTIRRKAVEFTHETDDKLLHSVRLDCKKMRYLLDCCRPLFGSPEAVSVRNNLRHLQDALGDFNDCVVQEAKLQQLGRSGAVDDPAALLTMGRLIERLTERRQTDRNNAQRAWKRFCKTRNTMRLRTAYPGGDG